MSSDPLWRYVNVRRLFIYVKESIDEGTQWVVFEPNDENTWARVRQAVTQFPDAGLAQRRAVRGHRGAGVLRALRPRRP